jgi:hypothetical protein
VRGLRSFALLAAALASAAGQSIQLADGVFRVTGWHTDIARKDWSPIFSVYAGTGDLPAMLGAYSVDAGVLEFRPRFPLTPGIRYRAVLRIPGASPIEASFDGPKRSAEPTTRIEHIYPSTDTLPSNLLKLYIVFSAPMSRGEAWKRIHLLDAAGRPVKGAFLEIDQELWDPELRRLTVLFDPGRIKRDLAPNLQNGVPILEGRKYTLAVDREFIDGHGQPLAEGFRKSFRGGPADRTPPDPATWRIIEPQPTTRKALVVRLPKPLDYALLLRTLDVPGVRGTVDLGRDEMEWIFTPAEPWKIGAYKISVDTTLEDLAGNRIGRAFDRNECDRSRAPEGKIFLPFEIR